MARTSSALLAAQARITELEAQLAARDARLTVAKQVFRDQRAHIAELEAQLNTRGCIIDRTRLHVATDPRPENDHAAPIAPVVTRYTDRLGRTFERTRVGSKASIREITTSTTLN